MRESYLANMSRRIDVAIKACKSFLKMTHCDGADCGIVGVFNESLLWLKDFDNYWRPESMNAIEPHGGTCLYDALYKSANYLCSNGDVFRPWKIYAVFFTRDNKSIRSVDECAYILSICARKNDISVYLIGVGSCIDFDELDCLTEMECVRCIRVKSCAQLENDLIWKVSLGFNSHKPVPMDYVFIMDASASMNVPYDGAAHVSKPSMQRAPAQQALPPAGTAQLPMLPPPPKPPGAPIPRVQPKPPRAPQPKQPRVPQPIVPKHASTAQPSVTVHIREYPNKYVHPADREIFKEFAQQNYPNICIRWDDETTEFLVLVESEEHSIVGLLAMRPYNINQIHIGIMVVDKEYRGCGIGTKMLTYVAKKYTDRRVTLNVDFEHPELLGFYCIKGYATLYDVSIEHKVLMLSLNHAGLFARVPLPE